jgi:uroporphyrinogen decarboxylase
MTERENAIKILKFGSPERIAPGLPTYNITYHGCNHEGYADGGHDCSVGEKWTDIWGTVWHKEHPGVMGFPRGNPLADISCLKSYEWPDPDDPRICNKIYQMAEVYQPGDTFLTGQHRDTLWEKSYMLVGMENMMQYLYTEPEYAREILHHIMDFQLGIAKHYINLGVEMISAGDDLGTQCAPLLNPNIIREVFMPEYKRLFDLYKSHNVIINFHSCGNVDRLLDIFIDLGVSVLNPIQATANNLDKIRAQTQGKMALIGGISTTTLMDGPIEAIVSEVKNRMWQLGRYAGYFCAPDQDMPFPQENIEVFREVVDKYGVYPIQQPD